MGAVFLSYAREDQACAEALARLLEDAGHQVWWDRRIESGSEFAAAIEAALDSADIVLVLWSKQSVKSRWVRDEAAIGGDSGRLVPVLIDGAQPPLGFRQFHGFDLVGWKGAKKDKRTAELLAAIARRAQHKEGGEIAPTPAVAGPRFGGPAGRRAWVIAAALALLVSAGAVFLVLKSRDQTGWASRPTIALAPFTTASPDPELRAIAAQSRESLSHMLSQSGMPVRSLSSAPQDSASAPGNFVLSGELGRSKDKLVATLRLDHVGRQVTVVSHRIEAGPDEAQDLPERIGAQIAGSIAWAAPLIMLEERHPSDPAVLADLYGQLGFTSGFETVRSYQAAQRAAAKAPNSAFAQVSLAFNTAFALGALPRQERPAAVIAARRGAERAKAIAPEFGDSYGAWCYLHSETLRAECENRLREGRRIDPDAPFLNSFLAGLLRDVGRYEESVEVARLASARDPYVPTKLGWLLRSLEYSGEEEEASELHRQGRKWWPELNDHFFWNRMAGRIDRGDFAGVVRLEQELGTKGLPANYRTSGPLLAAVRAKSSAGVARFCADAKPFLLIVRCFAASIAVGDLDRAYARAAEFYPKRVGRTAAETERIWLDNPLTPAPLTLITAPGAAPLRRDPRYLALADRLGLLAYWRSGRLPDFCRKQPEPICAQLRKQR
jgi:TolB-like protein